MAQGRIAGKSAGQAPAARRQPRPVRMMPQDQVQETGQSGPAADYAERASRAERPTGRPRRKLADFRGHEQLALMTDIAMGEWGDESLARMYDTTPQVIGDFCRKFDRQIQEVAAALKGHAPIETAGLWVGRKQSRLAEYQAEIEEIDLYMARLREMGVRWSRSQRDMYRVRLDLYRQIADEVGAYPQRQQAPRREGQSVSYIIEADEGTQEAMR